MNLRTLIFALMILVLAACDSTGQPINLLEPPERLVLYVRAYDYPDFVNYPTATAIDVMNPTQTVLNDRRLFMRCSELGIDTTFRSAPFTMWPGDVFNVQMPYYGGYRMMVDAGARCTISVQYAIGTPNWDVKPYPQ